MSIPSIFMKNISSNFYVPCNRICSFSHISRVRPHHLTLSAFPKIHNSSRRILHSSVVSENQARDGNSKSKKNKKQRLDEACILIQPHLSRNVIQSWISQGKVTVNGQPVLKSGAQVKSGSVVSINAEQPKYVCRAGLKMEKALEQFNIDPTGAVVLDAGLSTGGFTDCLLQHGAARVYGVDVGYGQVAERVRVDPRVEVMERTNLRHLKSLPEPVTLVSLDLSFISTLKVMPAVCRFLKVGGDLVVLVKPQFEAQRHQIARGGLVKDPAVHVEVITKVVKGVTEYGFEHLGTMESPIKGAVSGNTEFLAYFKRTLQLEPLVAFDELAKKIEIEESLHVLNKES